MKNIEGTKVAFVGAGNLATNLAKAMYRKGFRIVQVYSRTEESARALATSVEAEWTNQLSELTTRAELYIVALKDTVLPDLLSQLTAQREHALFVHTAGSVSMDVWKTSTAQRYGVFYPLQTFSKEREVDFEQIPFFIEAATTQDVELLSAVAKTMSRNVYNATSKQRKSLHLAAVFACNFTNHLYAIASDVLAENELPFNALLPLIDETAAKVHHLAPKQAQTGPAIRYDENVINTHLQMLAAHPDKQQVYRLLSESIHRYAEAVTPKE
ncbi:DUF2520 domain-containing protein [Bacteroides sp. 214]|uniref:Rossmann-like and DUF2520 domain-containing protein n=1 Tax=Bacteroides sp. 214 TaxID=2302935 RepID=UPI0013D4791E|nr:Rossmann-like and DUF2520 domain-containing protein [Bacteroides sp. 214]NDW12367.1 DUF2520 domain-containing protein [Bacteroides sp. 214]